MRLYDLQPRGVRLQGRSKGRMPLRADLRLRRMRLRWLRVLQQGLSG